MELIKKKKAILFFYIAICIAISGYLYPDKANWKKVKILAGPASLEQSVVKEIVKGNKMFNNSLTIEGAGLFLLLGWFAYKGDKEDE